MGRIFHGEAMQCDTDQSGALHAAAAVALSPLLILFAA